MITRRQHQARPLGRLAILLLALTTARCGEGSLAGQRNSSSPQESAGVFIGVEKFSHDFSLQDVSFAVNDAVDLAYALSIEHGVVPANRVLLLLAGEPTQDSRDHLRQLIEAGARRESARQADIYSLVEAQSKQVDVGGILILSISTHGISAGGEHLLMAEDSLLQFGTGVTAANILQATQAGPGGLRLLFIDACRDQLVKPSWRGSGAGATPDRRSAMHTELVETFAQRTGYAVFSAASEGEYAFSGDGHGYFTRSILDGLHCKAGETVKTLASLKVSVRAETVRLSPDHQQHPEMRTGGGADDFVLFRCGRESQPPALPPTPPCPPGLGKIQTAGNLLAVGGMDNLEQSFRLYRQAFLELPPATRASLNQGLVSRAQLLEEDSQRQEGIRLYKQVLDPVIARCRTSTP